MNRSLHSCPTPCGDGENAAWDAEFVTVRTTNALAAFARRPDTEAVAAGRKLLKRDHPNIVSIRSVKPKVATMHRVLSEIDLTSCCS